MNASIFLISDLITQGSLKGHDREARVPVVLRQVLAPKRESSLLRAPIAYSRPSESISMALQLYLVDPS